MKVPYKTWVYEEARRLGFAPAWIYCSVLDGKYPRLVREHVNQRVIFVLNPETARRHTSEPRPDEVTMQQWLSFEAEKSRTSASAIYMRLRRGKYPHVKPRRVGLTNYVPASLLK